MTQLQVLFADVLVLLLDVTQRLHGQAHAAVDRPADYSGKKRPAIALTYAQRADNRAHARRRGDERRHPGAYQGRHCRDE